MTQTLLVDCYPEDWKRKVGTYVRLVEPYGPVTVVDSHDLDARSATSGCDAVVLTGSPMMLMKEEPPAALVAFARRVEVPVLGICFGHQAIGLATGAELARREFYEGPGTIRVLRDAELFRDMHSDLAVFESHAEFLLRPSVERCGWEVLADSRHCPVEAMRHRERPLHCVQFHPEQSGEVGRRVVDNFYRHVVAVD